MKINKDDLKEIFNKILENYDSFDINISIVPEVEEMFNFNGNGKRFTTYRRTIQIKDKLPAVEDIIYNKTQHYGRAQFVRELAKLKQENKRLKERVEYLERSNDRREDEIIYLRQELNDIYEDKINKAIEYIYKNEEEYGSLEDNEKIILAILKGEENE